MDGLNSPVTVRRTGEDAWFAASNSAQGFYSWYGESFDREEITRLYAVKGGPGTGKSRLMREVAERGVRAGWQAGMVYCSSDPDSLDGVILTREGEGIAVLDATAPHVYEPTRPGYREELLNLGAFWDASVLRGARGELERLNRQKQEAYRRVYRCLAGYGAMEQSRAELTAPFLREAAIAGFAARLMREVPAGRGFRPATALMRAVGMRGQVLLDTYFAQASRIVLVEDCHGSAWSLMQALLRCAETRRLRVRVSRDPVLPGRIDGLLLCGSGLCFAVCPPQQCAYPHRRVTLRRFVRTGEMRPVRRETAAAGRLGRGLLREALAGMERVRQCHFEIERIYASAMDFAAKEVFTADLCDRLFGRNA